MKEKSLDRIIKVFEGFGILKQIRRFSKKTDITKYPLISGVTYKVKLYHLVLGITFADDIDEDPRYVNTITIINGNIVILGLFDESLSNRDDVILSAHEVESIKSISVEHVIFEHENSGAEYYYKNTKLFDNGKFCYQNDDIINPNERFDDIDEKYIDYNVYENSDDDDCN